MMVFSKIKKVALLALLYILVLNGVAFGQANSYSESSGSLALTVSVSELKSWAVAFTKDVKGKGDAVLAANFTGYVSGILDMSAKLESANAVSSFMVSDVGKKVLELRNVSELIPSVAKYIAENIDDKDTSQSSISVVVGVFWKLYCE